MSASLDPHRALVTLSALQHFSYCPRQCALIHLEQVFDENLHTTLGRLEHERVDQPTRERRGAVTIEWALPLFHDGLGLVGRADVVEFHEGVPAARIVPVEHKHGKRHAAIHDEVQLCAQALCLEEMFGVEVPVGFIFHVSSSKRREVSLDASLRRTTLEIIDAVRQQLTERVLPPAVADARCKQCSLWWSCLPEQTRR